MRLEHHLVGGYVRYISPYIIIIIIMFGYICFVLDLAPLASKHANESNFRGVLL